MASTLSISDLAGASFERAARRTLLFRVGATVYGADIDAIREIVPFRRATRLPGAPAFVQGLVNLRGTIVTVIDLGVRLQAHNAPAPVADGSIMLIALATASTTRLVGVAVEEVMDVRVLSDAGDGDSEVAVASADDGVVRGLAHIDGAAVILLDVHMLVQQVLLS